jgi:hypothetical protein
MPPVRDGLPLATFNFLFFGVFYGLFLPVRLAISLTLVGQMLNGEKQFSAQNYRNFFGRFRSPMYSAASEISGCEDFWRG